MSEASATFENVEQFSLGVGNKKQMSSRDTFNKKLRGAIEERMEVPHYLLRWEF